MNIRRLLACSGAAAAALICLTVQGCAAPKVIWHQKVCLNGRNIVFARIDSLSPGPGGHRVEYRNGDFIVSGSGPITVNGFEISAQEGKVVLANQPIELKPEDEVVFSSDMSWTVRQGPKAAPEAKEAETKKSP